MINVIIPVYNRVNYTISCINSLKNQDCIEDIKIFLIDDGSTDSTKEKISKQFPEVQIIDGDGTLFWGGAINHGIKNVLKLGKPKDWILLVNNDVELKSNAISELLKKSEIFDRKAIFSALSVDFEDKETIIKSGTIVNSWFFNITSHKYVGLKLKDIKSEKPIKVDFLTGRCLLHPIEIFEKDLYYDSKTFPHYGADDDFSMRIKKFGYSTVLCPSSIVFLKENKSLPLSKNFYQKLIHALFNIKSNTNIINKFNLSLRVVPWYAKITFFLIGVIKSLFIFFRR